MTGTNLKSGRQRLPSRRGSEAFALEASGLSFAATASRFVDGSLSEIFLQNHDTDSRPGIMASEAAIAASLTLQFGCLLDALCNAFTRDGQWRAICPLATALDLVAVQDEDA